MPQRTALCATYIGLIVLAGAMFIAARRFPAAAMGPAGPGFFPQVVAVLLIGLSVRGLVEALRMDERRIRIPPPVIAGMALSLGYIGAMSVIGFYPSTLLFCFAIMYLARDGEGILLLLLEALALTVVAYIFFGLVLKAHLPIGTMLG